MQQLQEYRAHAAECRSMAAQMQARNLRTQMLEMAAHWEQLAADREMRLAAEREIILTMREILNEELSLAPG